MLFISREEVKGCFSCTTNEYIKDISNISCEDICTLIYSVLFYGDDDNNKVLNNIKTFIQEVKVKFPGDEEVYIKINAGELYKGKDIRKTESEEIKEYIYKKINEAVYEAIFKFYDCKILRARDITTEITTKITLKEGAC